MFFKCAFGENIRDRRVHACACNFTSASGGSLSWRTGDKCSVASEELSTTAITLHSPELSRWSVPYSELNTMSVALRVGGFGNRMARLCSGSAAALMDLRWGINLLIEVTFVLSVIRLFHPSIPQSVHYPLDVFQFNCDVVKWDYGGLDHIWPVLFSISVRECNPNTPPTTPHAFCPISLFG